MTKHLWILIVVAPACVDDPVATTAAEIRGGVETTEPGVVGLWTGTAFCSAALISDDTLITAGTCRSGTADPQMIRVVERAASGAYRCLTATTSVIAAPGEGMTAAVLAPGCEAWPARYWRDLSASAADDFMVMRLESGRWFGKREGSHVMIQQTIRADLSGFLHADTPPDTYIGYGASESVTEDRRMRAGRFELVEEGDFFMAAQATAAHGTCLKDVGGPLGFHVPSGTQRYAVVGTLSRMTEGADGCVADGGSPLYNRTAWYTPEIEALLGRACDVVGFSAPGPLGGIPMLDCDNTTACTGVTPATTAWQQLDADTVYADVDTTSCGLTVTPAYFPTLLGASHHWRGIGVTSVFSPTPTGFRVQVTDRAGPVTAPEAQARQWRIGWQALLPGNNLGSCRGRTPVASTAWQLNTGPGGGIFVDVDTSSCGLTATPTYIATLGGIDVHDRTTGVSSVYSPTPTGFRIYLRRQSAGSLTPALAHSLEWHVNWLTMRPDPQSEYCSGQTPSTGWHQYGTNGLTRTVDISSCGLAVTPKILASLGGSTMHWNTTGVTSLYDVTQTSFQVFIYDESGPVTPADATARGWHVDWAVRQ
jgi:hypothetical protein